MVQCVSNSVKLAFFVEAWGWSACSQRHNLYSNSLNYRSRKNISSANSVELVQISGFGLSYLNYSKSRKHLGQEKTSHLLGITYHFRQIERTGRWKNGFHFARCTFAKLQLLMILQLVNWLSKRWTDNSKMISIPVAEQIKSSNAHRVHTLFYGILTKNLRSLLQLGNAPKGLYFLQWRGLRYEMSSNNQP